MLQHRGGRVQLAKKRSVATNKFGQRLLQNAGTQPDDDKLDLSAKPAQSQSIPNLADGATRKRLTPAALKAFVRIAKIWRLTDAEASVLAGVSSQQTWLRIKKGNWRGTLTQDNLMRVSAMIGIYTGLHRLYSERLADRWIRLANGGPLFRGRRPLDVIIFGGIPAAIDTRRHIDAS